MNGSDESGSRCVFVRGLSWSRKEFLDRFLARLRTFTT